MKEVTLYKNAYETTTPVYRGISKVLYWIKTGYCSKKIHEIRTEPDEQIRRKLKADLISICFSGKFTERKDETCIEHSGFAILDFDHIDNIEQFKLEFCQDEYVYAAFISPSGDGLKALVKIPAEIENHQAHYYGLIKKYPTLDTTSSNLSRVCFISYDPDIYINENSKVFTEKGEVPKAVKVARVESNYVHDLKKLNICCEMIRFAPDGKKHIELYKAAKLAGGFIAGGLLDHTRTVDELRYEINQREIGDFKAACLTIDRGISKGMCFPIKEESTAVRVKEAKAETDIIIEEEPARDVIYLEDVWDKIQYSYQHGTSRGETTYYPDIDPHWRWKRGHLVLMHGIMNHGKSTLMIQLCLAKSVKEGCKWGVFGPEGAPAEEFYKDLMHTYIGKSTEPYHSNQMSKSELNLSREFIREHFYYIYPQRDEPTPTYINKRFTELIIKHGISGCITDPYNQLDTDISVKGGREDLYLSMFLSAEKRFGLDHNVYKVVIAHPKGSVRKLKDSLDYECPDIFDLSGGAMWGNKCDDILCTYRPFYSSNKECTAVEFRSQKIKKQKLIGIPGTVELRFDRFENRFCQKNGYSPFAPVEHGKTYIPEKMPLINFNEPKDWRNMEINPGEQPEEPPF